MKVEAGGGGGFEVVVALLKEDGALRHSDFRPPLVYLNARSGLLSQDRGDSMRLPTFILAHKC
jgi:hypothetical protein